MAERFTGFPSEAIEFLDGLEANNNREWFQPRKDVYERACRAPMAALLAELEPDFGPGKVFRIYRDTRFSADKTPYKTYVAASFGGGYISLSPEGFSVASGAYGLEPDALKRFRDAVADDGSGRDLEKVVAGLERKGYELGSHGALKSAPRGYPKDHPRLRLLRHKGLYAWKGYAPGPWLATREVVKRVRRAVSDIGPLNEWLRAHVHG